MGHVLIDGIQHGVYRVVFLASLALNLHAVVVNSFHVLSNKAFDSIVVIIEHTVYSAVLF